MMATTSVSATSSAMARKCVTRATTCSLMPLATSMRSISTEWLVPATFGTTWRARLNSARLSVPRGTVDGRATQA